MLRIAGKYKLQVPDLIASGPLKGCSFTAEVSIRPGDEGDLCDVISAEPRSRKEKALAQWASRNGRGRKLQRGWWIYSGERFVQFAPYRYRCVGRPVAARYLLNVSIE